MKYRVVFAFAARAHVDTIGEWWAENRPAAPTLFREELRAIVRLLEVTPLLGPEYAAPTPGVRRMLIGRSGYHAYWEVSPAARTVTVTAVWHSRRGSGQPL